MYTTHHNIRFLFNIFILSFQTQSQYLFMALHFKWSLRIFFAPKRARGVTIFVHSFSSSLSRGHNLHLLGSQVSLRILNPSSCHFSIICFVETLDPVKTLKMYNVKSFVNIIFVLLTFWHPRGPRI